MLRRMDALRITLGPFAAFCLVASITPGPNNLLLMRSGAAFGVRRSASHMLGIQLGCVALLVLCHLGIGALLLAMPAVFTVLHWACFAYLLWLATMIILEGRSSAGAPAGAARPPAVTGRPMRWYESGLFQLINPKAWMMAVTMASAFYGASVPGAVDIAVAALAWVAIGTPSMLAWTLWGASIDRLLSRPRERLAYSWAMSLTVGCTALWMLQ